MPISWRRLYRRKELVIEIGARYAQTHTKMASLKRMDRIRDSTIKQWFMYGLLVGKGLIYEITLGPAK